MALSIYILLQPGSVISEAAKMGLGDTETSYVPQAYQLMDAENTTFPEKGSSKNTGG